MNQQEVWKIIVKNTLEVLPELEDHAFKPTDKLAELGANSVDRVEIITMSMEDLSLNIPRVELASATNIGELAALLHAKLQTV